MRFAAPELLGLLLVVGLMAAIAVWLARWRVRARGEFAGPQASAWRGSFSLAATIFLLEAAALIAIAAARPVWGTTELTRERRGVDIVIVLDISQSMTATDAQPTRLELAQTQLARLVEAERGNRFGLVLFAGTSIMRSPLTSDVTAITQLIQRASTEMGLVRAGSDIGAALEQAGLILSVSESAGKAVVLVSDGEDFANRFREQAAALRAQDIMILTAGVGTPEGSQLTETNRIGNTVTKVDASGRPVITRLDESSLREIAAAGGGRYLKLNNGGNLLGFREDLARLRQTPLGEQTEQIPVQRFQLFAAAAFGLLLVAWIVPLRLPFLGRVVPRVWRTRPGAGLAMLLLVIVAGACSSGDSIRSRNHQANEAFYRHSYQEALEIYRQLIVQRPDIAELSINAGNALHRARSFERAIQETQRALPPDDPRVGALTYYALGNHYLALEELELAYDSYRNALLLDPTDMDAKYNLEVVLLLLAGQLQEPPAQQGQQGQPGADGQQGGQQQQQPGQPGQQGQPGEAEPQPGEQQGEQGASEPGAGQPQQPGSQNPSGAPSAAEINRLLEQALRGINESLTIEEAQRILDLLRQQQQNQRLPGGGGTPTGPDY